MRICRRARPTTERDVESESPPSRPGMVPARLPSRRRALHRMWDPVQLHEDVIEGWYAQREGASRVAMWCSKAIATGLNRRVHRTCSRRSFPFQDTASMPLSSRKLAKAEGSSPSTSATIRS